MACCQTSAGFSNKEQDLWSNWILEFGFDTPGFQTNFQKREQNGPSSDSSLILTPKDKKGSR
jgi:hypothetical protein